MKETVFLAGTRNNSNWREELIKLLDKNVVNYVNPLDSTKPDKKRQQEEIIEKVFSDKILYVITPLYLKEDIYEIVADSMRLPNKALIFILPTDKGKIFSNEDKKELKKLTTALKEANVTLIPGKDLQSLANYLNKK